ncbi:YafY family transcriptional regulator [Rhodococcus sp. BP-349]|uniref:helix-turn-helix transcriptional regulator n=1 Tax=unclassified Rhodococcus (in: high G+C Gram-positive bacteria) TaxID=192944 RepID=UPI001C9A45E4|nr:MULTISPECIES: YafY family protein [unclassified Rhodococcus (in: high G+C Gram-positive bacteria)]MBY6538390.1 YafY family transcriptional regulator [Rhodococcus sp. BP-363]MBY6542727.1 YafY family transcriptional regulator [Rhodococcus sp. BP-369]MBY6561957.1 YafY family transcriptional regulator [Rhodococcus sp. BP-370]MBY6576249.1 YafY family transcriptional regulator [Rhodococcus sp. BP-364]MBY6585550.1 YafY family transcriptional regulator [Rhodococcus sp. BP-358]
MRETSARLLALLSLLQTRRDWSGADLAERLQITPRTVRRDVDRLRSLGYPVDGTVGVGGGYRLGAGAEMPPLLLTDDEVIAVALGLQSGASASVTGTAESSIGALTKLRQVMPSRLRHRLDALQIDVVQSRPVQSSVDASVLTALATVCQNHERLRFDYRTHGGDTMRREVEPYRLVRSGLRWYLVGWDLAREDWRSFRVDRLDPKVPTGPRFTPRALPEGGAAEFVSRGIDQAFSAARGRVVLHVPFERIEDRVDPQWGTLARLDDERCEVSITADTYPSMARWLAAFDVDFTVCGPQELIDACEVESRRLDRVAARYARARDEHSARQDS